MKKWEYRVEGLDAKNFNDEKSIKELKGFLSQAGQQGWELIGITSTSRIKEMEGFGHDAFNLKKCLLIFKKELE
jgi:hypothetical protein